MKILEWFLNLISTTDEIQTLNWRRMDEMDRRYFVKKSSEIARTCNKNGQCIMKFPSGKTYKIRELG